MILHLVRSVLMTAAMATALASCDTGGGNRTEAAAAETGAAARRPSTPSRTGYANVEGGRIYYQVYGDLNSAKTPLLVLHGSFMSADSMLPIVEPFSAGRPVIAIDARGHGRTGDLPGSITYELLADDAAAVLAALKVTSADVLGYSMGGTAALFLAVRHPDRVGKQITSPAPRGATAGIPKCFTEWRK
jgi:pimeloyl-ACP methyl ester carboxylesterase